MIASPAPKNNIHHTREDAFPTLEHPGTTRETRPKTGFGPLEPKSSRTMSVLTRLPISEGGSSSSQPHSDVTVSRKIEPVRIAEIKFAQAPDDIYTCVYCLFAEISKAAAMAKSTSVLVRNYPHIRPRLSPQALFSSLQVIPGRRWPELVK